MLDLTQHVAGPYCTRLLATYGATVLKVERPGTGDPMRHVAPFVGDVPGQDRSLGFLDLNAGKRGVTLNLKHETGRSMLLELARRAHVVVESFRPGTLDRLGLGYDTLHHVRPDLVLTSISNFGQSGPYRDLPASEIVLYAMGHEMFGTGLLNAEPLSMAPRLNLYFAGQTAAVGTMGAVLSQSLHGRGDWIDVSIMETFLSSIDRRADSLVAYAYTGERMERSRTGTFDGYTVPPLYNRCADGFVHIGLTTAGAREAFARVLQAPWLLEPRFRPPVTDPLAAEEFRAFFEPWCLARCKRDIVATLQEACIPCAPVNSVADLLSDPQLEARAFFTSLTHPFTGPAHYTGPALRFADTPASLDRPAPTLGQHNATVYGDELGVSPADLAHLANEGVI